MTTALGIDASIAQTGFAVMECSKAAPSPRVVHTQTAMPSSTWPWHQRLSLLAGAMNDLLAGYSPEIVILEGYGFRSFNAIPAVEAGTVLRYFLCQANRVWGVCPPTSLKKFVTGSGKAEKNKMLLAVYKQWKVEAENDHEADAIGLAALGLAVEGCYVPNNAAAREVAVLVRKTVVGWPSEK
jgi:Holliday junction resolvasome RuvABC endonuclease subunit